MADIATVAKVLEMDLKQARLIAKLFGEQSEDRSQVSGLSVLVLVVYDFFKRAGMTLEQFTDGFTPFIRELSACAVDIQTAVDTWREHKDAHIPRCMISLVDNRYVTIYSDQSMSTANNMWDLAAEQWVKGPHSAPVFTLTLAVPMLYFKVIAPHVGQADVAAAFKHAKLTIKAGE